MPRVRKDVWKLGQTWSDTLLWYARGVRELQKRPIDDPTSWRYLAAMHGIDQRLWIDFGYLKASEKVPPAPNPSWNQCQHQGWYFLPWHRGYLAAFEAILRAAIAKLPGAPSDWALPYWNYNEKSNPNALKLPPAFAAHTMPDGSPNPLFVTQRYGDGSGNIVLQPRQIDLRSALIARQFTGSGVSPGFGGPRTMFIQHGPANGRLENQPHNIVHSRVGGSIRGRDPNDPANEGLMSMPNTAALDPIFWLHHANIDRLWVVWLERDASHHNPKESGWLAGPTNGKFSMPGPDGKAYEFTPKDMLNTEAPNLDYVYEDISDPLGGANHLALRLERLGAPSEALAGIRAEAKMQQQEAELIGANDAEVRLQGQPVETRVRLDRGVSGKVARSLRVNEMAAAAAKGPDRVFLNLENIRGANDAAIFDVYINLPPGANPVEHPEHLAGTVSLFGVKNATRGDSPHAGNGINTVLEITDVIDTLHLNNAFDLDHLNVRLVPESDIRPQDNISVGRVSVYRQGQ